MYAQTTSLPGLLKDGLTSFERGNYREALLQFRDLILDSTLERYHGDAYYWIGRSHLALKDVEKAGQNFDFFLVQYPKHRLSSDASYQKGRILYLQKEYEKAIRQLYSYIEDYPSHEYRPNAYFWIAESFYSLGHLNKAEALYDLIINEFPRSFKVESAGYRKSLIDLKMREQELLRLLKISHEEYLKALEEFQQREKEYEQAIKSYQRRIAGSDDEGEIKLIDEMNSEITDCKQRVSSLQEELEAEKDKVSQLREELKNASKPSAATPRTIPDMGETDKTDQLLNLKNSAINLKMFYIEWLQKNREDDS